MSFTFKHSSMANGFFEYDENPLAVFVLSEVLVSKLPTSSPMLILLIIVPP